MKYTFIVSSLAIALCAGIAAGQGQVGLEPFKQTADLFVNDSSGSVVWRFQDLTLDGDFNDAGEVVTFYAAALGTVPLSNNVGTAFGPDGTLYVSDSTTDVVGALIDLDGDGNAHGVGENRVFFNGTAGGNASGVVMTSANNITVDATGAIWIASANTASGTDMIIRLQDMGGTFGANDAGEATVYATLAQGSATGASIPSDVVIGPGGYVYYLENGSTGFLARGIYRLHDDVVPNGNCNDPGEISPYFIPPAQAATAFHWSMALDATGAFYMVDTGNDIIWRAFDTDGNFSIGAGEASIWWQSPAASLNWDIAIGTDGALYACEAQSPRRIWRMSDTVVPNGNVNDPGEVVAVYSATVSSTAIGTPRGCALQRRPTLTVGGSTQIGNTATLVWNAQAGHPFGVWMSSGTTQVPVPPLGDLRISIFPPDFFFELYATVVPASGQHVLPVGIPNDNGLIGITVHLQGYSGLGVRVQLSNLQSITFQP